MCGLGDCCQKYTTCARLAALLLIIAGFFFSLLAASSCRFLSFDKQVQGESGHFGLFLFENMAGSCQRYVDPVFHITDQTARTGALLAPGFALVVIVLQLIDILCWRVCCGKCIETTLLLVAEICQGLTFMAFGSPNFCIFTVGQSCSVARGGVYTIIAFCLYFFGGLIACLTPEPTPIFCRPRKDEDDDDDDDEESSGIDESDFEDANQDEEKGRSHRSSKED